MRNFLDSVELPYLIESVDAGRKTSMETEYLTFYYCSQRQVIEELCEVFPHIGIAVFPQTFIVETITIKV